MRCRKLRTLNIWRAKRLTDVGLGAIANSCHGLEELDAGWWSVYSHGHAHYLAGGLKGDYRN